MPDAAEIEQLRTIRNAHYWDQWYRRAGCQVSMGLRSTYRKAIGYLDHPGVTLEDWGGGTGWAGTYVEHATYRLVDGAPNEWVDEVAELTDYRSSVECILMRHVLEHNVAWQSILDNLMASFTWRCALVLFMPPDEQSHDTADSRSRVPWWRFNLKDLTTGQPCVGVEPIGRETILYFDKRDPTPLLGTGG